jgi:hypothetical protein
LSDKKKAMINKVTRILLIYCLWFFLPALTFAKEITVGNAKITMTLDYGAQVSITSLSINGQNVINGPDGIFTSVNVNGITYSSLHLKQIPILIKSGNNIQIRNIDYGNNSFTIKENWLFVVNGKTIKWTIERSCDKQVKADESSAPVFNFNSINTWEGAYQGYGGLLWFYLFNEKLCTYGVHTRSCDFWNSKTGNGLNITVDAPGKNVAMKYSRTNDDKLAYTITTSDKELLPKLDSGTNRRRFVRGRTDVWSPFNIPAGLSNQSITFNYFDFQQKYGRGKFKGVDGDKVSAVLNTIARIGVIDSLHFGGNSWHTPYGPICLHEQYIAQLGLAINDPNYLRGYQSCLDYYCAHAIKPDGRVYPRWAYTNEDAMPGQFNKYGFYEAQWGILMDSNPDLVSNIAELYDMNGDKNWVKSHQHDCEKALDWILKRDSNGNGLVEMMTDNHTEQKSSDWIDIIWASYENAFVNAKLYHALVKWADIERQLNNEIKAKYYTGFAAKLKASFNKSTKDGGFWDEENGCYDHWRDKDQTMHGRNMVTPVNFMAIAYGICDDNARKKIILDKIETQMQREKLFFWPLCMTSYAPGEGKEWQFPFPGYENGDLFLSWGSIAIKAYAEYDPAIAVKYVKNVLEQYSKDGLAFQRYGRTKQDGLGDDILSGNSLTIAGLYQAIYGINPLYNRFYLDPHITSELAGTTLNYNFRGSKLVITLDTNSYSLADKTFKVTANKAFGFYATKNKLSYFNGNDADVSLQAASTGQLSIDIKNWEKDKIEWQQHTVGPIVYVLHQLAPNSTYRLALNGVEVKKIKSNPNGEITINTNPASGNKMIKLTKL